MGKRKLVKLTESQQGGPMKKDKITTPTSEKEVPRNTTKKEKNDKHN